MRVLFVPVSAPRGFGEYARAREIARAVQCRWPDAQLHFILSNAGSVRRAVSISSHPAARIRHAAHAAGRGTAGFVQAGHCHFRQRGTHRAGARRPCRRRARGLYQFPPPPARQGLPLQLDAPAQRTLDCLPTVHCGRPGRPGKAEAQYSGATARAVPGHGSAGRGRGARAAAGFAGLRAHRPGWWHAHIPVRVRHRTSSAKRQRRWRRGGCAPCWSVRSTASGAPRR